MSLLPLAWLTPQPLQAQGVGTLAQRVRLAGTYRLESITGTLQDGSQFTSTWPVLLWCQVGSTVPGTLLFFPPDLGTCKAASTLAYVFEEVTLQLVPNGGAALTFSQAGTYLSPSEVYTVVFPWRTSWMTQGTSFVLAPTNGDDLLLDTGFHVASVSTDAHGDQVINVVVNDVFHFLEWGDTVMFGSPAPISAQLSFVRYGGFKSILNRAANGGVRG